MRRANVSRATALAMVCALSAPCAASANATLGISAQPGGSTAQLCMMTGIGETAVQALTDASTPYSVPAGGGRIVRWQTVTTDDPMGAPITFVVLRPTGTATYQVVGMDARSLPSPLPVSGEAFFTPAKPIPVAGGETLGLYVAPNTGFNCDWSNVDPSSEADTVAASFGAAPALGRTVTVQAAVGSGGFALNLAATLAPPAQSVTVKTTAGRATLHRVALLSSSVRNGGPNANPIAFTDGVPTGLKVDGAWADQGRCRVSGQTVRCTITGLSAGQVAPVGIDVTPTSLGRFDNHVSAVPVRGTQDLNPSGNRASATLIVAR